MKRMRKNVITLKKKKMKRAKDKIYVEEHGDNQEMSLTNVKELVNNSNE
jgi:hypothetical protein